jgi:hypothetical protein
VPILISGEGVPPQPPDVHLDVTEVTVTLRQGTSVVDLTGPYRVLAGVEGFDDAAMTVGTVGAPSLLGELFDGVTVASRDVFLPVHLFAGGGTAWRAARDELRRVTNPLNGPTTITVATKDGVARSIDAYRVPSQTGWGVDTWNAGGWQALGLLFRAPRPWWVGDTVTLGPWRTPSTTGFLGTGFLPLKLGESNVFGENVTVGVSGDVPTWLTWVLDGTMTEATVTHEESGRSWTVDTSGLTMPLTVVTDPAGSAVVDGNGDRQWAALDAPFDLWPIPAGEQTVRVDITAADGTTTVTASAPTLHLAAL